MDDEPFSHYQHIRSEIEGMIYRKETSKKEILEFLEEDL